jgi:hypothetical protein
MRYISARTVFETRLARQERESKSSTGTDSDPAYWLLRSVRMSGESSQPEADAAPVTHVCQLRFADGQVVAARIRATSPHEESLVVYTGAVERLPVRCEKADAVLLRALFQSFARELEAAFAEEVLGGSPPEPDPEEGRWL